MRWTAVAICLFCLFGCETTYSRGEIDVLAIGDQKTTVVAKLVEAPGRDFVRPTFDEPGDQGRWVDSVGVLYVDLREGAKSELQAAGSSV